MGSLTFAALNAADNDFIDYLYLAGPTDPVVCRLLQMIDTRQCWKDVFEDKLDTPEEVVRLIDSLESDLKSAESMIGEQADEIHRLSTRTVVEMLYELQTTATTATREHRSMTVELRREVSARELAENKLLTWSILAN